MSIDKEKEAAIGLLALIGTAFGYVVATVAYLASILLHGFVVSWLLQWFLFQPLHFRPVSWLVISGLLAVKPLIHQSPAIDQKTWFVALFVRPVVLLGFGYLIHWWMLP